MAAVETPEKRGERLERNKVRGRKWYAANRERHLATSRLNYLLTKEHRLKLSKTWAKTHPDQTRLIRLKYGSRHREQLRANSREWHARNKTKANQRHRANQAALPEHRKEVIRARNREFYRNNKALFYFHVAKRKALKKNLEYNPKQIREWWCATLEKSFVNCYYCCKPIHASDAHMEHVIPLKRGGPHSIANLCTACPACNLSKGVKLPSEWVRLSQRFLDL